MKTFLIRGVPMALQQDGWWMSGPVRGRQTPTAKPAEAQLVGWPWKPALLVALIALGDVLVWDVVPGLSLTVFGAVLVAAALSLSPRVSAGLAVRAAGVTVLSLLPLIDLVQPLSLLIALVGLSVALALVAGVSPGGALRGGVRLWHLGPWQTLLDAVARLFRPARAARLGSLESAVMTWAMPLGFALVFALLLLGANPVLETWGDALWRFEMPLPDAWRVVFWAVLALMIWPCLILVRLRDRMAAPRVARALPQTGLFNAGSVARALVLLNAVMAVQTGMDAVFLYGGSGLPEGITYAQYAHRGAYPLVATALLAGLFALLSRRFTDGDRLLRALLLIWVAQNAALVVSSLVRLELYVEVYGLTRLRLSAAIWMALVASGLALMLWQVLKSRPNGWLLRRVALMAAVVLYAASLLRFDAVIAGYNLAHPVPLDPYYLCALGDAAKPVIAAESPALCPRWQMHVSAPTDWREWGFRNARARASLTSIQTEAPCPTEC